MGMGSSSLFASCQVKIRCMAWVPCSWELQQPYLHQIWVGKKQKRKKEEGKELSQCSLLSFPSVTAFCLRKCKRVPELVCDKDHPPFKKQGGKDPAQVPHAEGCEQGLKIDMLKPGVKRPPQLNYLLERKRPQVSSPRPPTPRKQGPAGYFTSYHAALTAARHHMALSPPTQSSEDLPPTLLPDEAEDHPESTPVRRAGDRSHVHPTGPRTGSSSEGG